MKQENQYEKNIPILKVYILNEEGNVVFKTIDRPLEITDKINLRTDSGDLYCKGQVKSIGTEGVVLKTSNGIVKAPLDARLEPLFLINSNNNKKIIEFGVNETISLLTKKNLPLHENYFGNRMKDFTDLLKGNKTSLLPFGEGDHIFHGKLQIRVNSDGKPFVNLDTKVNDLKSNLIQHEFLSEDQKKRILNTGELGLVDIKKPGLNQIEKMWVSVDKELNKLIFKNEKEIRIDGVYGVPTTEYEKNKLKSGEGTLMEILGENYFVFASAASKNSDGLRIFTEEKARELKLIPEENQEKTNDKTKSISF